MARTVWGWLGLAGAGWGWVTGVLDVLDVQAARFLAMDPLELGALNQLKPHQRLALDYGSWVLWLGLCFVAWLVFCGLCFVACVLWLVIEWAMGVIEWAMGVHNGA